MDHCRVVLAPVFGPNVELRQCIRQSSHAHEIAALPDRSTQDHPRILYLPSFHFRIWSNHGKDAQDLLLISRYPITCRSVRTNLAATEKNREKREASFVLLGHFEFYANSKTKLLLAMRFDERHNGTIAVHETSTIRSISYRTFLSYGASFHTPSITWDLRNRR